MSSDSGDPDKPLYEGGNSPVGQIPPEPVRLTDCELNHSVEQWLIAWLNERLKAQRHCLALDTTFTELGLDLILGAELAMVVSERFGASIDRPAVWDHPSIGTLATHLATRIRDIQPVSIETNADSTTVTHPSTL